MPKLHKTNTSTNAKPALLFQSLPRASLGFRKIRFTGLHAGWTKPESARATQTQQGQPCPNRHYIAKTCKGLPQAPAGVEVGWAGAHGGVAALQVLEAQLLDGGRRADRITTTSRELVEGGDAVVGPVQGVAPALTTAGDSTAAAQAGARNFRDLKER